MHDRPGWRVEFAENSQLPAQAFVFDAETGLVLAWSSGTEHIELISYTLDEQLDPALFTYTGPVVEEADERIALQAEHEEKQRALDALPKPAPAWYPFSISVNATDGDTSTGALDMSLNISGPSLSVRRWLTGTTPPEPSPYSSFDDAVRTVGNIWTYELTSHSPLAEIDARRILESIPPVDPPRPAAEIIAEQQAAEAAHELALRTPGTAETTGIIYSGPVNVSYMQFYLHAYNDGEVSVGTPQNFGLIGGDTPGQVLFTTGLHTGDVGVTLEIADIRPELALNDWEEVGEVPLTVDAPLILTGWGTGDPGVRLPISKGTYRLRYCANNMDAAREADVGELIDEYQITIWPSPIQPDELIKQTSQAAGYWNDLER
ncbi:hypothetical protein [Gordonia sp. CPCC 205333]|uniref:hypothetical protein n=1 Tax=Gordonia sp. CPCC 205333 TaxID=3140790 RepID=UPI003AF3CC48